MQIDSCQLIKVLKGDVVRKKRLGFVFVVLAVLTLLASTTLALECREVDICVNGICWVEIICDGDL